MLCSRYLRTLARLLPPLAAALLAQAAWAQTKPALVRNVDRPEAQPVAGGCLNEVADYCTLFTVPVGKTLVVEAVSFAVYSWPSDPNALSNVVTFASDQGHEMRLNPGPPIYAYGNVFYTGTQPLRMIIRENNRLIAQLYALRGGGFYGNLSFSGYLVDK